MPYELDANAVVTEETFTCYNCGKAAKFTVWRTPEYTKNGSSNLGHNVKYSDGTMVDGQTKGNVDEGKPGVNAYYTFSHLTKAVCTQCGTFNGQMDRAVEYCYGKNVYWLYDCDANFIQQLEEEISYEYVVPFPKKRTENMMKNRNKNTKMMSKVRFKQYLNF